MRMRIGKPMRIPRTPGAHATVRAYNSRQDAINCFAEAMRHLQDLGAAPQVTEKRTADFRAMVERFWTTRLTQLRREYGSADTDDVAKLVARKLEAFSKQ